MQTLDGKIEAIADDVAKRAAESFARYFEGVGNLCESPIEQLMLAALVAFGRDRGWATVWQRSATGGIPERLWNPVMSQHCIIVPQFEVGEYRADFCLLFADQDDGHFRFIVECDGHEWHERTREQARRDKARDRFFQAEGYRVFRFTGSEIWRDAQQCAEEIFDAAEMEWNRVILGPEFDRS